MRFFKYEALGNDFIVFNQQSLRCELEPALVRQMCDRHVGVGADGILLINGSKDRARMHVINSDASRSEMCGNGLRCVALHLLGDAEGTLALYSDVGQHTCSVKAGRDGGHMVAVTMPSPSWKSPDGGEAWVDQRIPFEDRELLVSFLSFGNPHAVLFELEGLDFEVHGPKLASHPMFPKGANVSFARTRPSADAIDLTVWERGAGLTQACGSGACAAAAAAVRTGRLRLGERAAIHLPGGTLAVTVEKHGVLMEGPARRVFDGEYHFEEPTR